MGRVERERERESKRDTGVERATSQPSSREKDDYYGSREVGRRGGEEKEVV
jgi:hypothetical protein